MRSATFERAAVVVLGLMFLPAGLQAAFWPRSFYDDFPIGRSWVAMTGGAYNEHLVWGSILVLLLTRGPGVFSLDYLFERLATRRSVVRGGRTD